MRNELTDINFCEGAPIKI